MAGSATAVRSRSSGTLNGVQVLRAVAALAVVYYHAVDVDAGGRFGFPSTGAWGVDVFFVISGFIISMTLLRSTSHFLWRRIFRVVPLYWVATLGWAAAVLVMPSFANSTEVNAVGLVKSLFFVPYEMSMRGGPILLLGWTLIFEMFFYLTVALLLVVIRDPRRTMIATAVVLSCVALSGFVWPSSFYAVRYFQSPVLFEFLAGVGLFFLWKWAAEKLAFAAAKVRGTVFVLAGVGLASSLAWLIAQDPSEVTAFGMDRVLIYGIASLVIVACALFLEPLVRDGRIMRLLLVLGSASYAIYLFHPFVLGLFSRVILDGVLDTAGIGLRLVLLVVTLAVVSLAGVVIDRFFDQPIQRGLKRRFLK